MKVALIQLTSVLGPEQNLRKIRGFLKEITAQDIRHVFLPECFYSLSDGTKSTPYLVQRGNDHYRAIQSLAKDAGVYLLGGSAATINPSGGKPLNRCYNFDPEGRELATYDKMNLFAVDLSKHESKTMIDESDIYEKGQFPQTLKVGELNIGLSICFDLRFPEIYRRYSFRGCNGLTVSSSFTVPTGKAHWHTLLRARAIENQCFVFAAAQWGSHNDKIKTYGHSLIIDPWGEILADAQEGEKFITATLDLNKQKEIRSRLNVLRDVK